MPFLSLVNGSSTGKEGTGARLSAALKTFKPKPSTSGLGLRSSE